jgi:hypothetical protein
MEFSDMVGKVLESVEAGDERIVFNFSDGTAAESYHSQQCCESVRIESQDGNIESIIGSPIVVADETCDHDNPPEYPSSWTWTHQAIRTEKGEVTFHWLGESNGYYGETPYFQITHGRLV